MRNGDSPARTETCSVCIAIVIGNLGQCCTCFLHTHVNVHTCVHGRMYTLLINLTQYFATEPTLKKKNTLLGWPYSLGIESQSPRGCMWFKSQPQGLGVCMRPQSPHSGRWKRDATGPSHRGCLFSLSSFSGERTCPLSIKHPNEQEYFTVSNNS